MDLDFNIEQEMLRKSVAEFLGKECPFDEVRELEESEKGYSPGLWKKMAQLGWMEACFPEAYGGYGESFFDIIIIMEEIGKKAYPSPFFSTVVLCGQTILEGGSEKQKKDLLGKIAAGKLIMALAQQEDDASFDPTEVTMPAELSGDQYVLNGSKMFVQDANVADKLIVAARSSEGVTLFLVDAGGLGISCRKLNTIGKDNICRVDFKDVKVSRDDLIGEPGRGAEILEKMSQRAVVAKCAEMVGGARESLEMTNSYAKQREQYGTPIGGFQIMQHYLADMKIGYETCANYLYRVAWMVDEGIATVLATSALKAEVNKQYKFITEKGVQIHGGIGTTREFNIGLFYRRAKAFEFVLGDADYHTERVAQEAGM
jgi:alkylation response protein AidB-like acyl-CoA dehydrogenase